MWHNEKENLPLWSSSVQQRVYDLIKTIKKDSRFPTCSHINLMSAHHLLYHILILPNLIVSISA